MWIYSLFIVLDFKQRKSKHEKSKRIFFQTLQSIFHSIITQSGKNSNIYWLQNLICPVQVRICEKIPSYEYQLSNILKILHRNSLIHDIKTKISSSHSKLFIQGCVISNEYSWWKYFQRYAKSLHQ
jgi:dsRNA-specific ribonuclease